MHITGFTGALAAVQMLFEEESGQAKAVWAIKCGPCVGLKAKAPTCAARWGDRGTGQHTLSVELHWKVTKLSGSRDAGKRWGPSTHPAMWLTMKISVCTRGD